ncbi:MAG: TPM domain-containing protein [Ruminococcus sp.]|nr:TPM domain-containing protein [Ruminococcus sp.]
MNKFSVTIITFLLTAAMLCGCSDDEEKADSSTAEQSASEIASEEAESSEESDVEHNAAEEEETTAEEPENHELERDIEPAEGTYVYDYAGILSEEDFAECNNYAEWLYENYLINAAVVITDDVEELTPEQYAEDAYVELYSGRGSGLLLLINNDTNEDYLYKTGSCLASISEDDEAIEFYWATQEIISGDYKSAVLRLLELGESCPQHVFDNGGIFTSDQIASLESLCTGGDTDISVLATSNSTESTNEEICRTYYDRHYSDGEGIMIMLDTESKTLTVVSDGTLPDTLDTALEEADALAEADDYEGALNEIITLLKG